MQGTVARFDPASGAASVLLDNGTAVDVPPLAFAASGLRLLRLGQRVRLKTDAERRVVGVALVTM
jgi:2-phospho-L-lactate guanylyltransferase